MQSKDSSQQAENVDILAHAAAEASTPGANTESQYECPFCVMMRKGGCEEAFKAFMECGERADKGEMEMADCLSQFEQLHLCMEKNQAVFDSLLQEMKDEEDRGKAAAATGAGGVAASSSTAQAAAAGGIHTQQHDQQQQQQVHQHTQEAAAAASSRHQQSSRDVGHGRQGQPAIATNMAPAS